MVRCDAIILAAGSGKRLESKLGMPKQFAELAGKPVWLHAVETISQHPQIGHVVLVLPHGSESADICSKTSLKTVPKTIHCVEGGILRQDSVHNGLQYLSGLADAADYVAIHDSARPFVPRTVMDRLLAALEAGEKAVCRHFDTADPCR